MSIKEKINYDSLLDLNELEEAVENLTSEERMELVQELYPNLKMKVTRMGEGNRGENKYKITLSNDGFKFNIFDEDENGFDFGNFDFESDETDDCVHARGRLRAVRGLRRRAAAVSGDRELGLPQ